MRPSLSNRPPEYAFRDILLKFQDGMPLACDQLNFLYRYAETFHHPALDAVCEYYMKQYKLIKQQKIDSLTRAPQLFWTKAEIAAFRKLLEAAFRKGKLSKMEYAITPEVFNHLRELTLNEMIYFHGYRLILRESFFPGWYPYSIYFQWMDIFGVAKYELVNDKKMTKTVVTLHLEPRGDRLLEECVHEYMIEHHLAFKPAAPYAKPSKKFGQEQSEELSETQNISPSLTLSRNKKDKKDDE